MAWVTIPDTDIDPDSPGTTALFTALRDNPIAIAQRLSGAPKIYGVAYDFQEFTVSGTWTKPTNAESGDIVIVQGVGGGGGGGTAGSTPRGGGGGGGGAIKRFNDIDDLGATESIAVGAGGAGNTAGGNSRFGAAEGTNSIVFEGGATTGAAAGGVGGGLRAGPLTGLIGLSESVEGVTSGSGGIGQNTATDTNRSGHPASFGGGGGGGNCDGNGDPSRGGLSGYAGNGGIGGTNNNIATPGEFPGGGGGGQDTTAGGNSSGGDGIIRVWCIREAA